MTGAGIFTRTREPIRSRLTGSPEDMAEGVVVAGAAGPRLAWFRSSRTGRVLCDTRTRPAIDSVQPGPTRTSGFKRSTLRNPTAISGLRCWTAPTTFPLVGAQICPADSA